MTRLALYVFFHKEGILEEYVSYYLKGLKAVCSDVVLIANGGLSEEAKRQLESLSVRYIIRENSMWDGTGSGSTMSLCSATAPATGRHIPSRKHSTA